MIGHEPSRDGQKELGHGGDQLVKRVYGHPGELRHRSELLEYRIEQHPAAAAERLEMLRLAR